MVSIVTVPPSGMASLGVDDKIQEGRFELPRIDICRGHVVSKGQDKVILLAEAPFEQGFRVVDECGDMGGFRVQGWRRAKASSRAVNVEARSAASAIITA
ncbi:MAG: hypothetical protein M5U09_13520 [Gammaproteobacteria bacterium]|nr:hypothetical protein [Gammaproteobacteria bacterium]